MWLPWFEMGIVKEWFEQLFSMRDQDWATELVPRWWPTGESQNYNAFDLLTNMLPVLNLFVRVLYLLDRQHLRLVTILDHQTCCGKSKTT